MSRVVTTVFVSQNNVDNVRKTFELFPKYLRYCIRNLRRGLLNAFGWCNWNHGKNATSGLNPAMYIGSV